jgi:hypothetical protein
VPAFGQGFRLFGGFHWQGWCHCFPKIVLK